MITAGLRTRARLVPRMKEMNECLATISADIEEERKKNTKRFSTDGLIECYTHVGV